MTDLNQHLRPHVRLAKCVKLYFEVRISGQIFPHTDDGMKDAYNHIAACMQTRKYGRWKNGQPSKKRDHYGYGIGGPVHERLMRWLKWRDELVRGGAL